MNRQHLHEMVFQLRHLMAQEDDGNDFSFPTLLREVPSITAPHTGYRGESGTYAELAGRFVGDQY